MIWNELGCYRLIDKTRWVLMKIPQVRFNKPQLSRNTLPWLSCLCEDSPTISRQTGLA